MVINIEELKVKKPQERKISVDNESDFAAVLKLHQGRTFVERKYDGYGIVVDTRDNVQLYSLSKSRWNLECVPELQRDLEDLPQGVYIGEIVGKETHPTFTNRDEFAAVTARNLVQPNDRTKRLAEEQPLEIRVYDILELEGRVLAHAPLEYVRSILEETVHYDSVLPVEQRDVLRADELQELTRRCFATGKEGFVVKNPRARYSSSATEVCGERNDDWLKIKRAVTFDLAVVGLYQTEARQRQGWPCSNALLCTYNDDSGLFETMVKLTIPSRAVAEEMYERVRENISTIRNDGVVYVPGIPAGKVPISYVTNPLQNAPVVEVGAMQVTTPQDSWHSCGRTYGQVHSLRHPVFARFREKLAVEATTTRQIVEYVGK